MHPWFLYVMMRQDEAGQNRNSSLGLQAAELPAEEEETDGPDGDESWLDLGFAPPKLCYSHTVGLSSLPNQWVDQ